MRLWATVSQRFWPGSRRGRGAALAITESYRRVFSGRGDVADAQAVLADLANHSGFYRVNPPGVSGADRAYADGQRAVFGRVFGFLTLPDEQIRALEIAARQEASVTAQEGDF